MTASDTDPQGMASPYATGGGGTVLEHRFGAVLLGNLLTGDPVPALGDDVTPVSVRFQASAFSPVDDLLLVGRTPDGGRRKLSIGVRRAPKLTTSEESSAHLLTSYLQVITEHWDDVKAGRWRLGLAVVSPKPAVQQAHELVKIARATNDDAAFRSEVQRPGSTGQRVRGRLVHLDALVAAAAREAKIEGSAVGASVLTWRLLSALHLTELRLEGAEQTDRTHAIARLRTITRDGTAASANDVFGRLAELAGGYAPVAAEVTELSLRRDLSGTLLNRSSAYGRAWTVLDGLATRLRDRTRFQLANAQTTLELDRTDARQALADQMENAETGPIALVVYGEPDVGKSALTIRAAEQLARTGAAVTSLSLRDLPATTVELERLLEGPLAEVLGATAVGTMRLIVIDGAESSLEGRGPLLTDVATAALRAGFGVVAVTRDDGVSVVTDALADAIRVAGGNAPPATHEVPRLTAQETEQVASTFVSLARLGGEPRAAWLLGRPGLIELLLRANVTLPTESQSEADVFAAIWRGLVRRNEVVSPGGPSPDARERALVSLAHRQLLPAVRAEPLDAGTLPSLRSDGLLVTPGPTSAWKSGDDFASDLVRDLSMAKLLITDGFALVRQADAPRWALRAVRLACQAKLAAAGPDVDTARRQLQVVFDDVAAYHGARWAEVPLEALLALGSQEALARVWPALLANNYGEGLRTLLRLALQRYGGGGCGDPTVLAPLVALSYCGADGLGRHNRYAHTSIGRQIRDLVLAWLRGLALANSGPQPLRQQVRDRLLAVGPNAHDEFAVEALALLGPDLNTAAETFLNTLAADGGAYLAPAVESESVVFTMSQHRPELLIALTEAFYVERHNEDGWASSYADYGIRPHQNAAAGTDRPMAAWNYGPFAWLLHVRPRQTLALINRMLDHATRIRMNHAPAVATSSPAGEQQVRGLDLNLPGVGKRRCVGDHQVWSWYRGTMVGPYPCLSALLAVERFADHLLSTRNRPAPEVVTQLLQDCHNLAMPGLVAGLLSRHLDRVGSLLDGWLTYPAVWYMESDRAASEGLVHVQGPDRNHLAGQDQRGWSFREVAGWMTIEAMLRGDRDRLAVLADIADELVRSAEQLFGRGQFAEQIVTVRAWAAVLRVENYRADSTDDGRIIVSYERPGDIGAVLDPKLVSLTRVQDAQRLLTTYARSEDRVAPMEDLVEDLVIAHELSSAPPASCPIDPYDSVAAVAAAAVLAHAQGRAVVPADTLGWAANLLIDAALRTRAGETRASCESIGDLRGAAPSLAGVLSSVLPPPSDNVPLDRLKIEETQQRFVVGLLDVVPVGDESTSNPRGADRSAAVALPTLLLPPFADLPLDRRKIREALRDCATSLFDEVRIAFARGAADLWAVPCKMSPASATCHHQAVWEAAKSGLRDCQLGDRSAVAQPRITDRLDGPFEHTVPTVPAERLLVNRLIAPIIAAAGAARSQSCISEAARRLLDVLFDAHRRGADHWDRNGYSDHNNRQRRHVVRILIDAMIAGDIGPLTDHVKTFMSNPRALDRLLHDMSMLFTYDDSLRRGLLIVWRQVMSTALDAIESGTSGDGTYWSASALGRLLPTPQLDLVDSDPERTLARARQNWVTPDAIADLVARYLPIAYGEPNAVDALAQLALCASPSWQATTGLMWTEDLVGGEHASIAGKCWYLVPWLKHVHESARLDTQFAARWRRLVDRLAAAGDSGAVHLQRADEESTGATVVRNTLWFEY